MRPWRVVSRHLFRRTADAQRHELERLQREAKASIALGQRQDAPQLGELGLGPNTELRTSPKRWRGYWRVEAR